jgi:hypothetical protein
MSRADIVGLLDAVAVVAGAFDHAGVGAVAAGAVEVARVGDLAAELGELVVEAVRGKTPPGR